MTCMIKSCYTTTQEGYLFCAKHVAEYVNPPGPKDRITVTVKGLDGWRGTIVLPAESKTVMLCSQDGNVEEFGGLVALRVARAVLDLVQLCGAADSLQRVRKP